MHTYVCRYIHEHKHAHTVYSTLSQFEEVPDKDDLIGVEDTGRRTGILHSTHEQCTHPSCADFSADYTLIHAYTCGSREKQPSVTEPLNRAHVCMYVRMYMCSSHNRCRQNG